MNGWVVLGYLAMGVAGALAFLRVVVLEMLRQDDDLVRQERSLRFEWESARESANKPDERAEPMQPAEPILVRPYANPSAAELN